MLKHRWLKGQPATGLRSADTRQRAGAWPLFIARAASDPPRATRLQRALGCWCRGLGVRATGGFREGLTAAHPWRRLGGRLELKGSQLGLFCQNESFNTIKCGYIAHDRASLPRDESRIKRANRGFPLGDRSALISIERRQFPSTGFYCGRELLVALKRLKLDERFDDVEVKGRPQGPLNAINRSHLTNLALIGGQGLVFGVGQ
jgi:hypothetical protein